MNRILNVIVTDKNAVYVNGTRITPRSTKWGVHYTIDSFRCAPKNVLNRLIERGHTVHINSADAAEFGIL